MNKNITVFCSASNDIDDIYINEAKKVALCLGQKGYNLIYGGDKVGLMGVISESMKKTGAEIYGVCIKEMYDKGKYYPYCHSIEIVESLAKRKEIMINKSNILLILPGGIGTINELLEVLVMIQLKLISKKKIIIFNINSFFTNFLKYLNELNEKNFLRDEYINLYQIVNNVDELSNVI